jgi:hypothetical protein
MIGDNFANGRSNILSPGALQFVLNRELQRALRTRTVLSLLTLKIERSASATAPDEKLTAEVGALVEQVIREQELLGYLESGVMALVLLSSDYARATRVADRIVTELEAKELSSPVNIAVGAASYPTHAMGAASLERWALSHPIATCRSGSRPPVHQK